jgi:hypothetical protein
MPHRLRTRTLRPPLESTGPFEETAVSGRDRQQRRAAADVAGTARCPVCRAPLVAVVDRRGPRFRCLCETIRIRE